MEKFRKWNKTVSFYTGSQNIIVVPKCFAFMFTNVGDTVASVEQMVIFPAANPATNLGDSRSLSGHVLDLYAGTIQLRFATPANANPRVEIVQQFYVDEP